MSDGPATQSGVFRWTATASMVRPGDIRDNPAISADGSVVVGTVLLPPLQAFRWFSDGTFQTLGALPGGFVDSHGNDASFDGSVVVGRARVAAGFEAYRWTEATGMVELNDLPGGDSGSFAFGVSGDGAVVVGTGTDAGNRARAFRWTSQSGMVELPELPSARGSQARKISTVGAVIVGTNNLPPTGQFSSGNVAVRWTQQEGVLSLGTLPGTTDSMAFDVSADGSVIVGSSTGFNAPGGGAFYWTAETGMLNLQDLLISSGVTNVDGWILAEARGVSADGLTVVGWGDHNGQREAFVATIPEPSTIILAVLAAGGLLGFYRFNARRVSLPTCRAEPGA